MPSLADDDEDGDNGEDDVADLETGGGANVQCQSRRLFRRPATGVSGQESLSDSEESRLSPRRAPPRTGERSIDDTVEDAEDSDEEETCSGTAVISMDTEASDADSELEEEVDAREEMVEQDDSRSEWAIVYLTVLISSSRGVRKETFFSAGKKGRAGAILLVGAWLFRRMEVRLWACL